MKKTDFDSPEKKPEIDINKPENFKPDGSFQRVDKGEVVDAVASEKIIRRTKETVHQHQENKG